MATQVSHVPIGDCRLCSLIFCHAHSAQILEFSRLACPGRFCGAFREQTGGRSELQALRQLFIGR
jgi:hypothetical protein